MDKQSQRMNGLVMPSLPTVPAGMQNPVSFGQRFGHEAARLNESMQDHNTASPVRGLPVGLPAVTSNRSTLWNNLMRMQPNLQKPNYTDDTDLPHIWSERNEQFRRIQEFRRRPPEPGEIS